MCETRNKKKISYDEQDPEFIEGLSSDSEAYIYTKPITDKKKKKSQAKKKDNEDWAPTYEPPDETLVKPPKEKKPKKPKKIKTANPTVVNVKTHIQDIAPALIERMKRSSKDPIVHQDPQGRPCPFIPYDDMISKILRPEHLFKKGSNGFNTLMPLYDPTSPNKLQFFNFEDQNATFDFRYFVSLSDEEIDTLLKETETELTELNQLPVDDVILVPPFNENLKKSISIKANVMDFDWASLGRSCQFDVILMDPPWIIQNTKMTRGVELGYEQMPEDAIASMPLHLIQSDGYVFMWVVAREFSNGLRMLESWGYEVINSINWIKTSKRGVYHPSNGYYLQHTKETVLVGMKGKGVSFMRPEKFVDIIVQPRNLRQSHKPDVLYKMIEEMFPGGRFIEIFARPHNLRDNWVSIGLEVPA